MIEITLNGSTSGMLFYDATILQTSGIARKSIIELNLMMDFGHLDKSIDSDARLEYADRIYLIGYPECVSPDTPKDILNAAKVPEDFVPGDDNRKNLKKLMKLLKKKDDVRIWYDNAPSGLCGFYALCSFLRDFDNKVWIIKAPRCISSKGEYWIAPGWGTFNMEPVAPFLPRTIELDRGEMEAYAHHWDQLVCENAPLRTSIGGVPVSVSEDFYDYFIYEFIPDGLFKISSLIAKITNKYPVGVNTMWYEKRLWDKIQTGEFEIVSKDLYFSDMFIQRT